MPVLPLVASTIVVLPGSIRPSASAASIIDTPMRSLTLPPGLNASSFANSSTSSSSVTRVSRTIGVRPTCSAMLVGISAIRAGGTLRDRAPGRRLPNAGARARPSAAGRQGGRGGCGRLLTLAQDLGLLRLELRVRQRAGHPQIIELL